ncbi:hypothetical protein [Oceanivirga salmonicida]|uniref:hypothetical protein n=1 Tax=Oceanivirga salmonicida TaxID=1769291 RepID=UPI0008360D87|nr:hypothetical protein [Oceanivirga salmonicida]
MKIVINGQELKDFNVLGFSLISNMGNYSKMTLTLELNKNINISNMCDIKVDNFVGKVYSYTLINYGVLGFKLELIAHSPLYLLTLNRKSRIYQDTNTTYKSIIIDIMKDYNLKYLISNNLSKKIGKLYFQDDISDKEFLTRILSDINESIFSSVDGIILFGFQDSNVETLENITASGVSSSGKYYEIMGKMYLTGSKISNLYLISSSVSLKNGIYLSKIILSEKNKGILPVISNIKGRFLPARVVEVVANNDIAQMRVDFSVSVSDKSTNKKLFSFATPYSKTMTSLYITPEISDMVHVYFPSNYEEDAKVAFCIDNEKSSRFCDRNTRNFFVEDVSINVSKANLSISSSKLHIQAIKDMTMASNSYLAIESKDDTSIYGDKLLLVSKGSNVEINSKKDILLKAIKIHNN